MGGQKLYTVVHGWAWPRIPWYMDGSLFLRNWYMDGWWVVALQNSQKHTTTQTKVEYPPPPPGVLITKIVENILYHTFEICLCPGLNPMVVKEKWIKVLKIGDHFYVLNLSCSLPTVSDLAHRHWLTILTLHYNQRLLKVAMWLQTVLSLFFVRLHMYYCKQYSQASSEVFVDWKISK